MRSFVVASSKVCVFSEHNSNAEERKVGHVKSKLHFEISQKDLLNAGVSEGRKQHKI